MNGQASIRVMDADTPREWAVSGAGTFDAATERRRAGRKARDSAQAERPSYTFPRSVRRLQIRARQDSPISACETASHANRAGVSGDRTTRHTHDVSTDANHGSEASPAAEITERLVPLLDSTHQVWASPQERRRLRAFGFRPAVETNVLKREWHGTQVRVGPDALRVVSEDGSGVLAWRPELGLTLDDRPFEASREGIALAEAINGLIQSYERWIEAREGREERLKRGHWSAADRRQVNALAETRRLNRLLTGGGGGKGRRR